MKRLWALIVALFVSWLAFGSPASAGVERPPGVLSYTYDSSYAPGADAVSHDERAPPEASTPRATHNSIGHRSNGASVRPYDITTVARYDYDDTPELGRGDSTTDDAEGVVTAEHRRPRLGGVAAKTADEGVEGGLNLFKWKDPTSTRPSGWRDGDYMLHIPWKGTPKATWAENSSRLRSAMRSGKPIYESYVDSKGNYLATTGFLNAERNILINRGWTYNPGAQAWFAP